MSYTFKTEKDLKDYISSNLLNSNQVAEILNCSRQYVHKLVKQNKLYPLKEMEREKVFWKPDILARLKPPK